VNLQLAGGPSVSTQISFVNGAVSQSRVYTYLLRPTATGTAQVGALTASFPDGQRSTQPIAIEVVPGSILPRARPPADPFAGLWSEDPFETMRRGRAPVASAKLFIEAQASRSRLVVGEPLLLTYFLYTQASVTGIELADAPAYPGFWAEELPREEEGPRGEAANRDGKSFQRFPVLRKLLYPTRAGKLTLPPTMFRIGIPRRGPFFEPISAGAGVIERHTMPMEITVEPLPVEAGFTGAVGKLRASASLDRPSLNLGEAATLSFRIEGTGNLRWIDQPPELVVAGAKVYPPQVKSDLAVTPAGLRGARTWEFVVVPERSGPIEIPALPFASYDPGAGRVVHSATSPLTLQIAGAPMSGVSPAVQPAAGLATSAAGLRLRSELDLPAHGLSVSGTGVAALVVAAILLNAAIWASALVARRRPQAAGQAPARSARKVLGELARAARGGMSKEAAAMLIENALTELFGSIEERAEAGGDERLAELRAVLHEARFLRYAPQLGDYSEKIREVVLRAAAAVRRWA
ncbi:MAG: BatD family protein, partial [Acidobacteriota bacterium]